MGIKFGALRWPDNACPVGEDRVSTLYFETDTGDGFRETGFSKGRRLDEPQITIGLLVDADGFPLRVESFEGNKAETTTMIPAIKAFMAAHRLTEVTIVADAGMLSDSNKKALEPRACRSSSAPISSICRGSWPIGTNATPTPR